MATEAIVITARRAATRQRLLTAASAIIAERGLHGATVEDISEAAGFTRGAFYSNFADKEELFSALLFQEQEEMLAQIARVVGSSTPVVGDGDVIDQLLEEVLAVLPCDRESHLVHAEFALHAIRHPEAAAALVREGDRFRRELAGLIEAGLARAGRRLVVPPAVAVAAVITGFDTGMREVLLREAAAGQSDPVPPRQTLPLIIRALSEVVPSR